LDEAAMRQKKISIRVGDKTRKGILARFKNGVFWVPVDEPMPTGKRQLIEGVE